MIEKAERFYVDSEDFVIVEDWMLSGPTLVSRGHKSLSPKGKVAALCALKAVCKKVFSSDRYYFKATETCDGKHFLVHSRLEHESQSYNMEDVDASIFVPEQEVDNGL